MRNRLLSLLFITCSTFALLSLPACGGDGAIVFGPGAGGAGGSGDTASGGGSSISTSQVGTGGASASSGSTGGATATSSADTTTTADVATTAVTTTSTSSGGSCATCSDLLADPGIDPATLCPDSVAILQSLLTCVCQGSCADECLGSVCQNHDASNGCKSCIVSQDGCGHEYSDCALD